MDIHRCRFVPYAPAAINALAFTRSLDTSKTEKDNGENENLGVLLAVGRANGDIEIWNPLNGAWVQETIFRGGKDRSVEGLTWIEESENGDQSEDSVENDNGQEHSANGTFHTRNERRRKTYRLFSIGYSSTITEWDLARGIPKRHSSGNHSEVWCLAAQPVRQTGTPIRKGEFTGQNIVAGCADGTLVVLSTADDDLTFQRLLSRPTAKKARVLSVAFQNRDVVVAGYADSMIRVYNFRSGAAMRSISFGGGAAAGPREILVWAVKCLPSGMIVSGDSSGEVRFFDGQTYSQLQRLVGHEADVLDVAASADGRTVFSCSLDRRVVKYRLDSSGGGTQKWARISRQRYHKHDIKALAVHEGRNLSVVVSGGVDANLNIIPLRGHGKEYQRTISGLPQQPAVQSAPKAKLVASFWDREVHIWRIGAAAEQQKPRQKVARILVKGEENIASVSLSADGSLVAVATAAEVKVFQTKLTNLGGNSSLKIRKMECPEALAKHGAKLVQLSPDGKWLAVVTHENRLLLCRIHVQTKVGKRYTILGKLVRLARGRKGAKLLQSRKQINTDGYVNTINRLDFSSDSSVLVAGDLAGSLDIWALEGREDLTAQPIDIIHDDPSSETGSDSEDSDDSDGDERHATIVYGQHWVRSPSGHELPRLDSAPIVLSFRPLNHDETQKNGGYPVVHQTRNNPQAYSHQLPQGERFLFVLTAKHQMYEFEVMSGKLSSWSRKNPTKKLPSEFRRIRDRAMGCIWDLQELSDGRRRQRIWLYGSSWLSMFDLEQDFAPAKADGNSHPLPMTNGHENSTLASASRKRKRNMTDGRGTQKVRESGAGSRIAHKELRGIDTTIQKTVGPDHGETVKIRVDASDENVSADSDEDEDDYGDDSVDGLVTKDNSTLINGVKHDADGAYINGTDEEMDDDGKDEREESKDEQASGEREAKKWHCAYKYRPILGMVALGETGLSGKGNAVAKVKGDAEEQGVVKKHWKEEKFALPEVAIVERPFWDLDLPPRFVGVHERE